MDTDRAAARAIGEEIRAELRRQGRSVVWLARELSCDRTTCYRIFRSHSIDTLLLWRISRILDHDFFDRYRCCLPPRSGKDTTNT
ncbi:MAG: XRE family transcriptional regulator [Alistipes sp.]|nr:XRE family transcriptional regulator [Alistipes sp.]